MLVQGVGINYVDGDWLPMTPRQLTHCLPHLFGVIASVVLLQPRPVALENFFPNPKGDGSSLLYATSSHEPVLLTQQRLDVWCDVFRISGTACDGSHRIELVQQSEGYTVEAVECCLDVV